MVSPRVACTVAASSATLIELIAMVLPGLSTSPPDSDLPPRSTVGLFAIGCIQILTEAARIAQTLARAEQSA